MDGARGAGLGAADGFQPFLLPSAGEVFSFHQRDEVTSAAKNLVCKIICVAREEGDVLFILQFLMYSFGKEPEVIFLEVADLIHSPQP